MRSLLTQTRLQARQLQVWRAVAAAGRRGTTTGQLAIRFEGIIDYAPLRESIKSLKRCAYLRFVGQPRLGVFVVTDRIPIGEERPAWMDEEADEPPPPVDVRMPAQPMSAFTLAAAAEQADLVMLRQAIHKAPPDAGPATDPAATPAAPPAATPAPAAPAPIKAEAPAAPRPRAPEPCFTPLFALDSAGRLQIDMTSAQSARLDAPTTRALFSWLDRIGGSQLTRLVQPEVRP